jgi:6-phosphogluconolactonase (cycloisomerase 2 family)
VALSAANASAAEGDLTFLRCLEDPGSASGCPAIAAVDGGIDDAADIAVSPDGSHVYVVGSADDSLAAFARDPSTGGLTFIEREDDGVDDPADPGGTVDGMNGAFGVTISPDGKHLYVLGSIDGAVATFARNPTTGSVSFVDCIEDTGGPSGCPSTGGVDGIGGPNAFTLTISPDGRHVYVTSFSESSVAAFARNSSTGSLTFVGCLKDDSGASGCPTTNGVDGIRGARGVAVSPDGANVYVTGDDSDDSLATFARNSSTGALTFIGCLRDDTGASGCPNTGGIDGLNNGAELVVSPDGGQVYVSGSADDALSAFDRDPSNGALAFIGCLENVGGASATCPDAGGTTGGLGGVRDVALSPDGKHLYGAGGNDDSVTIVSRNPATGALSFAGCLGDTGGPSTCPTTGAVDGLDATVGVAVTPDGAHVYTAGFVDSAVATFRRDPDLTTPDTTGLAGPPATTADQTPAFSFSSDDLLFTRFECRVDLGPFESCSSPFTSFALADGPHRFQARALDTAGNVDQTPAESSFTVDTAAPATSITAGPPAATTDNTPEFSFTGDDAGATFACRIDSGPFAACSSPFTASTLPDGSHRFQVRATDAVGNVEAAPAESSFTVDTSVPVVDPPPPDTTAPDTDLTSEPAAQLTAKKKTVKAAFEFAASEAGSRFECRLDSAAFSACTSPQSLKLKVGAHTFRVRAIDAAGNADFSPAKGQGTVIKKKKRR